MPALNRPKKLLCSDPVFCLVVAYILRPDDKLFHIQRCFLPLISLKSIIETVFNTCVCPSSEKNHFWGIMLEYSKSHFLLHVPMEMKPGSLASYIYKRNNCILSCEPIQFNVYPVLIASTCTCYFRSLYPNWEPIYFNSNLSCDNRK
jgi:hypothetical protein